MKNNNSSKLLWVVIVLTVAMILVGIGGKALVDKVADLVIQKLQKEYSPSPYGPGIDPDKLDPEKLKTTNAAIEPIQPIVDWEDWESQSN